MIVHGCKSCLPEERRENILPIGRPFDGEFSLCIIS